MPTLTPPRSSQQASSAFDVALAHLAQQLEELSKLHRDEVEELQGKIAHGNVPETRASSASCTLQQAVILPAAQSVAFEKTSSKISSFAAATPSQKILNDAVQSPGVLALPVPPDMPIANSGTAASSNKSFRDKVWAQYVMRRRWNVHDHEHVTLREMVCAEKERHTIEQMTIDPHIAFFWAKRGAPPSNPWCFVLCPTGKFCVLRVMISILLLMYDLIMVPFDLAFSPDPTDFTFAVDLGSAVFWSVDIPLTFITGVDAGFHVEMELMYIAKHYIKSWFILDICLVLPEWLSYLIANFPGGQITIFRSLRWGRLVRMLRVARVMRIAKMKPLLRVMAITFHLSKQYVLVTKGWFGLTMGLLILVHLLACLWYGIGRAIEDGWVEVNHYSESGLARVYAASVRWTVNRIHGIHSGDKIVSTAEMTIDSFLVYASLIMSSYYIGKVCTVSMTGAASKTMNLWKMSVTYVHRHEISTTLHHKMIKALESGHFACAGAIQAEEMMLLEVLPQHLQEDVLFEARRRHLVTKPFFSDLYDFNTRAVRHICNEAMKENVVIETECLFSYGDACQHMTVVDYGRLRYFVGPTMSTDHQSEVEKEAAIGEAILWTSWEHKGQMLAIDESVTLHVNPDDFAHVLAQHKGPYMHAARYARHFVWYLNSTGDSLNDLTQFPFLTIHTLDDEEIFQGTSEDHFIFISHYKVEAGTEATLMRDLLGSILQDDLGHIANQLRSPIFIDSEDLTDLANLKAHVQGSTSVVLLLTPNVLTRPWCLVEIVTAQRSGVNIVLVEVQRPGCSYRYPDEQFYESILAGELVDEHGQQLLASEGILLDEVESVLRQVFLKIALPFSPHKTKTIREAELHDILKRCSEDEDHEENLEPCRDTMTLHQPLV